MLPTSWDTLTKVWVWDVTSGVCVTLQKCRREAWSRVVSWIHLGGLRQMEIAWGAGVWIVCSVRVPVWKFNPHCGTVGERGPAELGGAVL